MRVTQDRSAVLLIRAWLEGEGNAFRARVSAIDTSGETPDAETTVAVVSTESDVIDAVRRWLEEFAGSGPLSD